mgnify:FL=1
MKILITGMTNLQSGAIARRRLDYISTPMILVEALKECGYKVDWRPIRWGESLSKYDLVMLGLSQTTSVSCIRTFHALWATKYKHLLFVNDWKVRGAYQQLKLKCMYKPYFWKRTTSYYTPEEVKWFKKNKSDINECIESIKSSKTIFAPLFNWGNSSILLKGTEWKEVLSYDPTPFYLDKDKLQPVKVNGRKKAWVCGALYDYTKQLDKWGLKWPIVNHTSKSYISEQELIEKYKTHLGVISPHYYNAGSGWFRFRFLHAIQANALLRADSREVENLGMSYSKMENIEHKDNNVLRRWIKDQREFFLDGVNSRKIELRKLKETIENAYCEQV